MRGAEEFSFRVYCADYRCSHSIAISGDAWPDDARLSDIEGRFICQACCHRGADVRSRLDRPFALFGHCLGALTMFETARALIHDHGVVPSHMFVSGARPPDELHRQQKFEEALTKQLLSMPEYTVFEPVYRQPDKVFAEAIRGFRIAETERLLASAELRQLMLPTIRAEFEMGEKYRYRQAPPLDVPITCLTGINDAYVTLANAQGWRRFTRKRFQLHTLVSEHFIVVEDDRVVLDVVNREMAEIG